jgi:ribonuclease P protein component
LLSVASRAKVITLRRSEDFLRLKKVGRTIHVNSWILLAYAPNSEGVLRCGWTIPKFVGTAVVRNRIRRWLREFFGGLGNDLSVGVDVNVVIKRYDKEFFKCLPHSHLDQAVAQAWRRICRNS